MKCEKCGFKSTRVRKSVKFCGTPRRYIKLKNNNRVYRRRVCEKCGYIFTTREVPEEALLPFDDLEQITRERDDPEARLSLLMAERDYGQV